MKEIISKFIKGRNKQMSISQEEIIEFISESYFLFKNKYPTSEELQQILAAFRVGVFSLEITVENIIKNCNKFGFNVSTLYSKNGEILNTYIY